MALTDAELVNWVEKAPLADMVNILEQREQLAKRAAAMSDDTLASDLYLALGRLVVDANFGYGNADVLALYDQAQARATSIGDTVRLAAIYLDRGITLSNLLRRREGQQELFRALALYQSQADSSGVAETQRHLCDICRQTGEYELALELAGQVVAYYHRHDRPRWADFAQLCELVTYQQMGDHRTALRLADEMLQRRLPGTYDPPLGNDPFVLGVRRDALLSLRDTTAAIATAYRLVAAQAEVADIVGETAWLEATRGQLFSLEGRPREALPPLRAFYAYTRARRAAKEALPYVELLKSNLERLRLDTEALAVQNYLTAARDTLHRDELAATRNDLRAEYRSERREATIAAQRERLQVQRARLHTGLGVGALLLLLLGATVWAWRANRRQSRRLRTRNRQNETLLREVHHRVRNNLEIVSSLLELQADTLPDPRGAAALTASRHRVTSLGLLHDELYRGAQPGTVQLQPYLTQLADALLRDADRTRLPRIEVHAGRLELDLDRAIPLGLIVTELVGRSLRNADCTTIAVTLRVQGATHHLRVTDDGRVPVPAAGPPSADFGTRVVHLLSAQLDGRFSEGTDGGYWAELEFNATALR